MEDAAGIVTVQRENLDWAYTDKWVNDLELEGMASCPAAGGLTPRRS
jgi:hypothetical protein